jgi:hypothetical protein
LAKGRTLPAFGGVVIDEFDQMELLGEVVEGGDTAKVGDASAVGLGLGLLEALEEGVGGTQVGQDDGPGATVHAAGLDEIVVGVAVNDLALDGGHQY